MFRYDKTATGYRFNGGDQYYEVRHSEVHTTKWDLWRNAEPGWAVNDSTAWELVAEDYDTRHEAAADGYNMDGAALRARAAARAAEEAKVPAQTTLRAEFAQQYGGSQRAGYNRQMTEKIEAALAEAVEAERTRIWRALVEDGGYETVMGGLNVDGEAARGVLRIRTAAFRTILWSDR